MNTPKPMLILPLSMAEIEPDERLLFFAGPVRGGGRWQETGYRLVQKKNEKTVCAIPFTHREPDALLSEVRAPMELSKPFERQTDWERHYIEHSMQKKKGCLVIYLKDQVEPRPPAQGPYGRDTYGEVGWVRAHLKFFPGKFNVVFGAEENFSGLRVITRNLFLDTGINWPVYTSLEETLDEALKLAWE